MAKGVLFLAAALLLAGCASGPPLVKDRYAGEPGGLGINPPDVRVSAVALERPAPARGIALTALAPEAQAEMVKAHEGKPPLRLSSPAPQAVIEPMPTVARRVVIALRRDDFPRPGDRLSAVRLEIAPNAPWRIVSWDRLATELGTVTVGSVEQTDKTSVSASTGLNIGGPLADTEAAFEQSRSVTEKMGITDEVIQTASITPDGHAWIEIRGGWGKDLALNIVLDLEIGLLPDHQVPVPVRDFGTLFTNGEPLAASNVKVSTRFIGRPNAEAEAVPLHATISFVGQERQITDGARTFTEADDRVTFARHADCVALVLAPPQATPSWSLGYGGRFLVLQPEGADKIEDIRLAGWAEAIELLRWLAEVGPGAAKLHRAELRVRTTSDPLNQSRALTAVDIAALRPVDLNEAATEQAIVKAMQQPLSKVFETQCSSASKGS